MNTFGIALELGVKDDVYVYANVSTCMCIIYIKVSMVENPSASVFNFG